MSSLTSTRPRSAFIERITAPDLTMFLVVTIWGVNFTVAKTSISQMGPLPFTAIRFFVAAILLALLLRWREGDLAFPPGSFWKLLWLGVIGNTLYQALFAAGLARTTPANSSLILTATPVMVALAGGIIGLERITRYTVIGLALALSGIVVVMLRRGAAVSSHTLVGDLLTLGSVVCWTAYVLGVRSLGGNLSSLRATTLTLITGTPGLLLLGLPGLLSADWRSIGWTAILGVFYSAVLAVVLCYLLYNRNVRLIGGVRTTIYGCAIPVIAALVAWPALGERPTLLQGIGAVLIVWGVLIARRI